MGEPVTNHDLFRLLADAGWIGADLERALRAAAGFRNVLVHGYTAVDVGIVKDVLENHLDDLLAFAAKVRGRLSP